LPVCPPGCGLAYHQQHCICKSWFQCRSYSVSMPGLGFLLFLKILKILGGPIAVCLFAHPGCEPAYHQLNNIACKLLKLVPVQKLYRVYARFVTREAQGVPPWKNVLDIVRTYSSLKNLGHSQRTLRPSWCPKLVTGLVYACKKHT